MGLAQRIEAALRSILPPADLDKLSPAIRRLLVELRTGRKPKESEGGDLITLHPDQALTA